jgi:hypothetical protein
MLQETGRPNANDTISAWADVVVKMWRDRITELPVMDTKELYNSFILHVIKQAGGDLSRIEWMFKQYGIYQDMGVGRETARGNSGDLGAIARVTAPNGRSRIARQPKPWYSSTFYREVMKIKEYMAFWYAEQSKLIITEAFGAQIFDQRYTDKTHKTVGSLKTQLYRERNNSRFRKNYREFGFASWKSRNKH